MAKKSRRERKLEKEAAERQKAALEKADQAYSHPKIRVCYHCDKPHVMLESPIAIPILPTRLFLVPVSDTECVCEKCKKRFPIKDYQTMRMWLEEYNPLLPIPSLMINDISNMIKPVKYYYSGPNEITYVEDNKQNDQ